MAAKYSQDLEDIVLGTLSFYEKMNESFVIMDLDSDFLMAHPELNKEVLSEILEGLVKKKLARKIVVEKEVFYQRVFRKPSLFKRLKRFLGM